jgi:hypothetical protein
MLDWMTYFCTLDIPNVALARRLVSSDLVSLSASLSVNRVDFLDPTSSRFFWTKASRSVQVRLLKGRPYELDMYVRASLAEAIHIHQKIRSLEMDLRLSYGYMADILSSSAGNDQSRPCLCSVLTREPIKHGDLGSA